MRSFVRFYVACTARAKLWNTVYVTLLRSGAFDRGVLSEGVLSGMRQATPGQVRRHWAEHIWVANKGV